MTRKEILSTYVGMRLSSSHSPLSPPPSPNILANCRACPMSCRVRSLCLEADAALDRLLSRDSENNASSRPASVKSIPRSDGETPFMRLKKRYTSFSSKLYDSSPLASMWRFTSRIIYRAISEVKGK